MILKLIRYLIQLAMLCLIVYFGYYYFTHQTVGVCVSAPLANLVGKAQNQAPDKALMDAFLSRLSDQAAEAAARGMALSDYLTATSEAKNNDDLFDKGQYLYCKAVVAQNEQGSN